MGLFILVSGKFLNSGLLEALGQGAGIGNLLVREKPLNGMMLAIVCGHRNCKAG